MEKALILVKTKSPTDPELFTKIKSHPGVVEANLIYGPYDIYSLCEDTTTMGIKRIVMNIRNMSGVISTLTCLISD